MRGRADMVIKMSESKKVLHFPTIAQPNIEEVLTLFLKEQQKRLKTRTLNRYEEVIDLLRHCLNGHGYHDLDNSSEVALYEKLYFQKNLEFCLIFGPEKILSSLSPAMMRVSLPSPETTIFSPDPSMLATTP